MTANRRIVLNIFATYGRSLYALAIGLFCGRWTLMALGELDYGLMGVVGGLIAFVSFLNSLMASAVGRFYAFSVGEAKKDGNYRCGLENCRKWFNTALCIHVVLPTVLIVIGYPIGSWAIENYLVIPADKVIACIWVWRFSCISCFVGMVNVPFSAMYTAKQEIAELTIYSFVTTTLNAFFVYYMVTHPGFWLVKFSGWMACLGIVPQILISVVALIRFPECAIRLRYLWSYERFKDLTIYAGGLFLCGLAQMFSRQGVAVAVNKMLGPVSNAAMSVGNTVVSHASRLTSSCTGALYPAITNFAGSGDYDKMRIMAFRMCKLSTVATMLFAVPLLSEVDTVLDLWLVNPPLGAAKLCAVILGANIVTHMTDGHWMAIYACGRVTWFNINESIGFFLGFLFSVILMFVGVGIEAAGYGLLFSFCYGTVVKLYYCNRDCGMSVKYWIWQVAIPLFVVCVVAVTVALVPRMILRATFLRVCLTTIISEMTLFILIWVMVFDRNEKLYVKERFLRAFERLGLKGAER